MQLTDDAVVNLKMQLICRQSGKKAEIDLTMIQFKYKSTQAQI